MPLVGYIHPLTRRKVAFDYFDTDVSCNKRSAFPPWAATYAANKVLEDLRHTGLNITTTTATGCPRGFFLERLTDYFMDPNAMWPMTRGTAMHSIAAKSWPSNYVSEREDQRGWCDLRGELFGYKMSGLVDCMRVVPGRSAPGKVVEIADSKFPSDWSSRYRTGAPKPEHIWQLNVNRLLLAQQGWAIDAGYNPDDVLLTVWDHASGGAKGPVPIAVPIMNEASLLAIKPFGGVYTIKVILDLLWSAKAEYEEGEATSDRALEIASRIPLVGETQMNGKKCQSYCSVSETCDTLVRTRGIPATMYEEV